MKAVRKFRRSVVLATTIGALAAGGVAMSNSAYAYLDSGTVKVYGGASCPYLQVPKTVHLQLVDGQTVDTTFNPYISYQYFATFTNIPLTGTKGFATYTCAGPFGTSSFIDNNVQMARPLGSDTSENLSPN